MIGCLAAFAVQAVAATSVSHIDPSAWTEGAAAEGWRAVTLQLPPSDLEDPAILIHNMAEPYEIVVNGETVKPMGPPLGPHGGWHRHMARLLPGAGNVVTVRFPAGSSPSILERRGAYVGDHHTLIIRSTLAHLPGAAIAVTALVLGLVALMIFARRREQKMYIWFAAFSVAQGVVLFTASGLLAVLWDAASLVDHLRLTARAVAPPALVLFFLQVTPGTPRRADRFVWLAAAVGLVLVAVDLLTRGATHTAIVVWNNVLYLGALLTVLGLLVRSLLRGLWEFLPATLSVTLVLGLSLLEAAPSPLRIAPSAIGVGLLVLLLTMGDLILRRLITVFEALQEEVRARDEFLSVVSHELRNPLAAMMAGADLLWRQAAASEPRQHLEMIRRQGRLLTRLMDDLLDLGRIRAGRLKVELHPIAVATALGSAVEGMRHQADAKRLTLQLELPDDPVAVEADPTRFEQMVTNLIRNAVQHTPAGGRITVRVSAEDARVLITILDTGRGLTSETLGRIFSPGAAQPPPSGEGLGVGLALVRKLAQMHGGHITARSEGRDRGSEFTLELRRAPLLGARMHTPSAQTYHPPPRPKTERRVLVIDDNANLRLSMRLLLEHSGYRVQEAADGRAGLENLLTGAFDAAVVDLRMPEIDGLEVARRIRAQPEGSRLRLVALTGLARPEDCDRAKAAGFDHVLVKPADPDQLAAALR